MNEVAIELGCDWHTDNDAVIAYGTVLVDDPDRIGHPTALGLDETLFFRQGPRKHQCWSTSIVDVASGRLLDVVAGRSAASGRPLRECRGATRSSVAIEPVEAAALQGQRQLSRVLDADSPTADHLHGVAFRPDDGPQNERGTHRSVPHPWALAAQRPPVKRSLMKRLTQGTAILSDRRPDGSPGGKGPRCSAGAAALYESSFVLRQGGVAFMRYVPSARSIE